MLDQGKNESATVRNGKPDRRAVTRRRLHKLEREGEEEE